MVFYQDEQGCWHDTCKDEELLSTITNIVLDRLDQALATTQSHKRIGENAWFDQSTQRVLFVTHIPVSILLSRTTSA